MNWRLKKAYEEGQFQAMADLGVVDNDEGSDKLTKMFNQLPDGEDPVDSASRAESSGDASADAERDAFERKHVDEDDSVEWSAPEITRGGLSGRY